MKLFSALQKGLMTAVTELNKTDSVVKGERFEEYVREQIFTSDHFSVLEKSHAFMANKKDFVRSSLNPDFKLYDKVTRKEFWLEVKFRSEEYGGRINWCTESQLQRYLICHRQTPTFVILGIGGEADVPERLYLLSMTQAKYTQLFDSLVTRYEIPLDKPVTSQLLWCR